MRRCRFCAKQIYPAVNGRSTGILNGHDEEKVYTCFAIEVALSGHT
jgi:hypothetical protein